ncbi:uncharacterized protein LOC115628829 [Scaptodrosophila lebanonensis]|uniref:Uncharacterized protein LOC115628829 n=1 Tax=Drosophila lebanonensis TaxID=7225 RepID=A0A6J2TZ39_DROLE|nr:uncharacterized protein LOC115628829 [Scaptodrosophila lebanonensis]
MSPIYTPTGALLMAFKFKEDFVAGLVKELPRMNKNKEEYNWLTPEDLNCVMKDLGKMLDQCADLTNLSELREETQLDVSKANLSVSVKVADESTKETIRNFCAPLHDAISLDLVVRYVGEAESVDTSPSDGGAPIPTQAGHASA